MDPEPDQAWRPVRVPRTLAEIAERVGGSVSASPALGPRPGSAVTGIAQDSREVVPGDLYVGLAGERWHGAGFAAQAAARGAVAALVEPTAVLLLGRPPVLPWIAAPDLRRRLGPLASWVNGDPSAALELVGVTGTNGKTSTAYLLEAGMAAAGHRAGLLSGVAARAPGWSRPAVRTTAEACELQRSLAELVARGVTAAAVEVSSHALALHRVDGTVFRAAVFTNLGRDHLDLHGDMTGYLAAKAALFEPDRCGVAVVGVDDEWGPRLLDGLRVPAVTVSSTGRPADWSVSRVATSLRGVSFRLTGPGVDTAVDLRLLGAHQADNAACAVAALVATGADPADAVRGVEGLTGVPGRLERVDAGQPFAAFVDYVHNEAGQLRVYPFLRSLTHGRLVVVMGATGDRDPGKRAPLGRVAGAAADVVVVTDESPNDEDPAAIRAAVAAGARSGGRATVLVEPDRAAAFDLAVSRARPGDVVVVCGRGHDPRQVRDGVARPFDDSAELLAALRRSGAADRDDRLTA